MNHVGFTRSWLKSLFTSFILNNNTIEKHENRKTFQRKLNIRTPNEHESSLVKGELPPFDTVGIFL